MKKFVPFLIRIGVKGRLRLKIRMAILKAWFLQQNSTNKGKQA